MSIRYQRNTSVKLGLYSINIGFGKLAILLIIVKQNFPNQERLCPMMFAKKGENETNNKNKVPPSRIGAKISMMIFARRK